MTKVLTIRIAPELLAQAEAKAARLGMDRANYVRGLIEQDVETADPGRGHRFASEDLVGAYEGTGQAATNEAVKARMRERAASRKS